MKKLAIAIVLLAAIGFAIPVTQAATISLVELGLKSSLDGFVWDTPYDPDGHGWPPPDAVISLDGQGLGTITYTFSTPGTHYLAGFFDFQVTDVTGFNGLDDEWGFGQIGLTGTSATVDDPWNGGIYSAFLAYNSNPANAFDNASHLNDPLRGDVALAIGYTFALAAGDPAKEVTFTTSTTAPGGGTFLYLVDPKSSTTVYVSIAEGGGAPPAPIPEPGTLTLVGLGLAAAAWRLRRRA